jgi:hypothetical protein
MRIEDRISGTFASGEARLHLHPDFEARAVGASELILLRRGEEQARVEFAGAAEVAVQPGTWHPQFGLSVANQCIVAKFAGGSLTTSVGWTR